MLPDPCQVSAFVLSVTAASNKLMGIFPAAFFLTDIHSMSRFRG